TELPGGISGSGTPDCPLAGKNLPPASSETETPCATRLPWLSTTKVMATAPPGATTEGIATNSRTISEGWPGIAVGCGSVGMAVGTSVGGAAVGCGCGGSLTVRLLGETTVPAPGALTSIPY